MTTICKFQLSNVPTQVIIAPEKLTFLSIQEQRFQIIAWALVDTDTPSREHTVRMLSTGEPIPADVPLVYLGTVQEGLFVRHFFKQL